MSEGGGVVDLRRMKAAGAGKVQREIKHWLSALAFTLVVLGIGAFFEIRSRPAMDWSTPKEHIEASRQALQDGRLREALEQAETVKSGPEADRARQIETEIAAAEERQKAFREGLRAAISAVQNELREHGYDVAVAQSEQPAEFTVTSDDFGETESRVRFLEFLRSKNGPGDTACIAGYQNVRLRRARLFSGFSEAYSLECSSR